MVANSNFGFTPEYTMSMGWTLLQNMLVEYSSMNNTEDETKGNEISVNGVIRG